MRIYATFANFRYDPDAIQLVHAWDEYSRDENPSGYTETLKEEVSSYGTELLRSVTVAIRIPEDQVRKALLPKPLTVEGTVESCERPAPG